MTPAGHRRLILTRHAKSAWDDPRLEDFDRPLNRRGRRAALELGEWLHSRGYEPEEVLCSSSKRTRETWTTVSAAPLEVTPKVEFDEGLYHAGPDAMLKALRQATGDCVMLIGHNPGIAAFAGMLPARAPVDPDFHRYPTAATLVVDFDTSSWSQVEPGKGSVLDFFVPSGRD
ncbi:histidine phosphatase family protein [Defluviimonas sp. WL0002]|uniref:Histidine phosphatase family protein n=1 Tax=Albidovulum marisflavi TaxID=2984159 RepID=A0ABT2ZF04_9RHOB|nr:histidine phosphatase family protein [Defluviimonas sp. WL0002]MCV2869341.1 histidine phosphatase family protein [Defluviimonas sp. WL0002]